MGRLPSPAARAWRRPSLPLSLRARVPHLGRLCAPTWKTEPASASADRPSSGPCKPLIPSHVRDQRALPQPGTVRLQRSARRRAEPASDCRARLCPGGGRATRGVLCRAGAEASCGPRKATPRTPAWALARCRGARGAHRRLPPRAWHSSGRHRTPRRLGAAHAESCPRPPCFPFPRAFPAARLRTREEHDCGFPRGWALTWKARGEARAGAGGRWDSAPASSRLPAPAR